jgi:lipoprotein NlpD
MLQRFSRVLARYILVIGILITSMCMTSCGTNFAAQVSDRSPPPSRGIPVHEVARGETLYSIAWRYGIDYRALAQRNNIRSPYIIYPGQRLQLIAGNTVARSTPAPATSAKAPPPMATRPTARPAPAARPTPAPTPPRAAPRPQTAPSVAQNRSESKTTPPPKPVTPPLISGSPQWQWPAQGPILSTFQGSTGLNKGIDIAGTLSQPVIAAAAGHVVYAGEGLRGYGKLVIIKHNDTFLSAYAHSDRLLVKEGTTVKAGQRIADMGSSGTDRVKLHFEIRREGTPVDPLKYLPKR